MNKSQILAEMQRLEVYLKEQKMNLPGVVFDADTNVKVAQERLEELQIELDKQIDMQQENSKIEQKKIKDESDALSKLIDKLILLRDEIKSLQGTSIASRRNEIVSAISQVTRR